MTITTDTSSGPIRSRSAVHLAATATVTQNQQMANIAQDLQNQLNRQLAAIQPTTDQVSIDMSQNRINSAPGAAKDDQRPRDAVRQQRLDPVGHGEPAQSDDTGRRQ